MGLCVSVYVLALALTLARNSTKPTIKFYLLHFTTIAVVATAAAVFIFFYLNGCRVLFTAYCYCFYLDKKHLAGLLIKFFS